MEDHQDAYGHAVFDYLETGSAYEIVERDDGLFAPSGGPPVYFSGFDDWPAHLRQAMDYVSGRVLDIGCGPGRHALYLQSQGFDVTGVDVSPLAIEVCRRRGLKKAEVRPITQVSAKLGTFETILMLGNNFGLFGSFRRAKWLLRRFHAMTGPQARIIAESNDPYQTTEPLHREYQAFNRQRGRMPGQLRIRVRYKKYVTPWFDYLLVSRAEMKEILDGTGWAVKRFLDSETSIYVAVIEKQPR